MTAASGFLERAASRGPRLAFQVSAPEGAAPRGAVLLTHGYGEHSGRYGEVVAAFVERGLVVASYDLRGHGHSGGPRGHIESFDDYLHDADDLLRHLAEDDRWRAAGKPVLFGHSLGGLISTSVALAGQERFRALAMTSPFFALALPVPGIKKLLGRGMSRMFPRFAQASGLAGAQLTHDREIAERYDADPLGVKKVTARWFTETEQAQERAFRAAPELRLPLFCLAAGEDIVASTPATERFFELAGSQDKELQVLQGQFHEVLNEIDRAPYIAAVADWISARAGA